MYFYFSNQSCFEDEYPTAKQLVDNVTKKHKSAYYVCNDIGSAFELAKRGLPYSLIYHQQGPIVEELTNFGRALTGNEIEFLSKAERTAFTYARRVHFPSYGAEQMYFSSPHRSVDRENVSVGVPLYNTIIRNDINANYPVTIDNTVINDNNGLTILSVGTLTIAKGQDQSIRYVEKIVKKLSTNIRYIVVGDGPLSDEIDAYGHKIAKENKNFEYIRFKRIDHDDVLRLNAISDIYLMLHRISIFDLATLEAMDKSSALILSNVGGNVDFDKENNVLYVDEGSDVDPSFFKKDKLDRCKQLNKQVFEKYFSNVAFRKQYEIVCKNIESPLPSVKVLVCYHKPSDILSNEVYVPIHVGRALSDDGQLMKDMIGDDIGDNISDKNAYYSELTAQYWAWKNIEQLGNPEYIGLMHYRRLLNFYPESIKLGDPKRTKEACMSADIILQTPVGIHSNKRGSTCTCFFEQYREEQHIEDLIATRNIIQEKYPEMLETFIDIVYRTEKISWCNVLLAKRDIFIAYSEWLFDVLFLLEKRVDLSNYTSYEKRIFGFVSEILLNVYVAYLIKTEQPIVQYYDLINTSKMKEDAPQKPSKGSTKDMIRGLMRRIIGKAYYFVFNGTRSNENTQPPEPHLTYDDILNVIRDEQFTDARQSWNLATSNSDLLLNHLEYLSQSTHNWETQHSEIWLMYMCLLLEKGRYDQLKLTLSTYIVHHKYSNIERYLPLSAYIHEKYPEMEQYNNKIAEAAEVQRILTDNRSLFSDYIKDKSVAIVGNAGSQIGKNTGSEIDAHDVVIRFNNYPSHGYEQDYGAKTTIWVRGSGANDIVDRVNVSDYDMIIWEADYDHFRVHYDDLDILYRYAMTCPDKLYNFDYELHRSFKEESGATFPSTGAMAIWATYQAKNGDMRKVDIYGFSFSDPANNTGHFFDDKCKLSKDHDMGAEQSFLRRLVDDQ